MSYVPKQLVDIAKSGVEYELTVNCVDNSPSLLQQQIVSSSLLCDLTIIVSAVILMKSRAILILQLILNECLKWTIWKGLYSLRMDYLSPIIKYNIQQIMLQIHKSNNLSQNQFIRIVQQLIMYLIEISPIQYLTHQNSTVHYNLNLNLMDTPFVQKAIPMVAVDQHTGKYVLTTESIKFLRAIQGPIAVVSVAGLYRTGKSYLLNRVLLNRSNGFGVGPTVNPCTKGLWCWGTPIKGTSTDGEQVNIIVIDTEGIGALDEDQTHDTKIFTLAILASSCFIYNSVGSIDENAVQNLSLVVNLTKHIQLKAAGQDEDGEDPDEIASYFPSFFWVVRDFSLQLQDAQGNPINSKQYLQRALAPQNGFSDDIEQKNRIRRLLTAFFKDRDCYTMIRPLVDQMKLQNLDKMDYDELRPEFVHQAMAFRKRIITSVKVKTLQNKKLSGDLYCSMMSSYVTSINEGAVPNIENAWNYMCEEQCRKSLDQCFEIFVTQMKQGLKDFPKPQEQFNKAINQAEDKALESFRQRALGDRSSDVLKELKARIKQRISEVRQQNIKESNNMLRQYIKKNIKAITTKISNQEYRSFSEFQKELTVISERFNKDGLKLHNYKYVYMEAIRKLLAQGAEFIFKSFSKHQEKSVELFKEKEKQLNTELESAKQERQGFRKKYMETATQSDQRISDLTYKLQALTTQFNLTSRSKQEEQKKMERQISMKHSELQSIRRNFEEKVKDLTNKLEQSTRQLNNDRKEWEKEKAVLDLKVKQQSIQIDQLQRRQKNLDTNFNITKAQMTQQVRQTTLRLQKEKEDLKKQLTEQNERTNELTEEMNALKQEMEGNNQKFQKKQKKSKDELNNCKREMEKTKKQFDAERKQLKEELENSRQIVKQEFINNETKLRQSEKVLKQLSQRLKGQKNNLEKENVLMNQNLMFTKQQNENLKSKVTQLKQSYENAVSSFNQSIKQENQEKMSQAINGIRTEHARDIETLSKERQAEVRKFKFQIQKLVQKREQMQSTLDLKKNEFNLKIIQSSNIIEQLTSQNNHLRHMNKNLENQKSSELFEKKNYYQSRFRELEMEFEDFKEKSFAERNEYFKESEMGIAQIKNSFEMEKENLERKLKSEKDKHDRKYNDMVEQYEKKLEDEIEPLHDQIQNLRNLLANSEEHLRNTSSSYQNQLEIARRQKENTQKQLSELKDLLEKKEVEYNYKYENALALSKSDRQKLQQKIESMISEANHKDKDIMSLTHQRDQYLSNLEKKQAKMMEFQAEMMREKERYQTENDKIINKLQEMEKDHYEKSTVFVKQNALYKQENEFRANRIAQLQKNILLNSQLYEEKVNNIKEEKDMQFKSSIQKITLEKNNLQNKYREFKQLSKDTESSLKKSLSQLSKERGILQQKLMNIEMKLRQTEQKKVQQVMTLQFNLTKAKEDLLVLQRQSQAEMKSYRQRVEHLENQNNDMLLKFEKDKSLLDQKIRFLQNSKEENKRESQDRIKKLESQLSMLQNARMSDKSIFDSNYNETLRNQQNRFRSRIQQLQDNANKSNYEHQTMIKDKDQSIKELSEKYQTQKMQKENTIANYQKRLNQISQNERRLREEVDRLKKDRQARQNQYIRKQKEDKENYKTKINTLQSKLKDSDSSRMTSFFQLEKEKSKWKIEKENLSEKISTCQQQIQKLERQREKLKIDNQKLKNDRKNVNKGHSYISGMKTYYEPMKQTVEQNNKQNLSQQ